jgi:hypothetical protein
VICHRRTGSKYDAGDEHRVLSAWKVVFGVLVCGLTPHAMDLLEAVRGREDGYERIVEDVAVKVKDSDAMTVAAYVYRKSPSRLA